MGFRKMLKGFRAFQHDHYHKDTTLYERLSKGQSPKIMIIACSDSRIDPAIITRSEPGEIFSVRNVAAMVAPNETGGTYHGTAAAVEYAVTALKVDHIVVMGHAFCGGIDALAQSGPDLEKNESFIARWISIGADARDKVRAFFPQKTASEHSEILERTSLLVSINNLMSYGPVREAVEAGRLKLHAWYFDIKHGTLLNYNPASNTFEDVLEKSISAAMSHVSLEGNTRVSISNYLMNLQQTQNVGQ